MPKHFAFFWVGGEQIAHRDEFGDGRARKNTDQVLDAVDQIRDELESRLDDQAAARLYQLAARLEHIGVTMLAANKVMADDFDSRLGSLLCIVGT